MANSPVTADLKNCKIENPFSLVQLLAQYVGSNK